MKLMVIKKGEIGKTLIIAWFIVATLYVGYDLWSDYKIKGINAAYQAGITNTVNQLLEQVEKNQCQPFEIQNDKEKKMQLIDAQCAQQAATAE